MIRPYAANNVPELLVRQRPKSHDWVYVNPDDHGKATFERCIENPWVEDKVSQVAGIHGSTLFDFGCNRARYILDLKKRFDLRTFGLDAKSEGQEYVDTFFCGVYSDRLRSEIMDAGPYNIATCISAVEHAGHDWHPDSKKITAYQQSICSDMIACSQYFFLTVPFGRRPGWAKDKSRTNLYQFDIAMLDYLKAESVKASKNYMEEIYCLADGKWVISNREQSGSARYRGNKMGASAIALISIWKEP